MSQVLKIHPVATSTNPVFALWAGATLAALLVASGAILHDREPVGLAVGVVLALACTRIRGGKIGYAMLALLGADVAFFTVLETAGNLAQPTELLALAIPTALAATAVVVLATSLAMLLGRPFARQLARRLTFAALAVAVAILAIGAAIGPRGQPASPTGGILVRAQGQAFSQTQLAAPSGEVRLTVTNGDLFYHTFTVDQLGVNVVVPVGGERIVTFKGPPGIYRFYCAIPGHAGLGMQGTLTLR